MTRATRARAWVSAEIARRLQAEIVDARSELESSMQARVDARVDALAADADRDAHRFEREVTASLDRVATALEGMTRQLASVAHDHQTTVSAVELVVREMALAFMRSPELAVDARASTVLGGTIEPGSLDLTAHPAHPSHPVYPAPTLAASEVLPRDGMGPESAPLVDIELEPAGDVSVLHVGCVVEVRSRFQNRWVDGFEIVEILEDDGASRYQLARHADHVRLPALFDASDLRPLDLVDDIVIEPALDDDPAIT